MTSTMAMDDRGWLIYRVVIVSPGDSVLTATQKMVEVHASSAVVAVGNKAQGILTYVTDQILLAYFALVQIKLTNFC